MQCNAMVSQIIVCYVVFQSLDTNTFISRRFSTVTQIYVEARYWHMAGLVKNRQILAGQDISKDIAWARYWLGKILAGQDIGWTRY